MHWTVPQVEAWRWPAVAVAAVRRRQTRPVRATRLTPMQAAWELCQATANETAPLPPLSRGVQPVGTEEGRSCVGAATGAAAAPRKAQWCEAALAADKSRACLVRGEDGVCLSGACAGGRAPGVVGGNGG